MIVVAASRVILAANPKIGPALVAGAYEADQSYQVAPGGCRPCVSLGRERRPAEALASAIRQKLKAGEFSLDPRAARSTAPRFGEYAARYIEHYAKAACKFTTWRGYEVIFELHLLPAWRDKRLD